MDPDQAQQNVGPDLDPNFWHSDGIPKIFEKFNLKKKKSADNKKACKITQHAKSYRVVNTEYSG